MLSTCLYDTERQYIFSLCTLTKPEIIKKKKKEKEGRKEGKEEGRKEGRKKEGRKEREKERRKDRLFTIT